MAAALPGPAGPQIVEMLLNALAHPDARAEPDDSYNDIVLVCFLSERNFKFSKDVSSSI